MGRIEEKLTALKNRKKKALVFFLTAGFPNADSTPHIVAALESGGADMVEIGMPFSDPLADGPIIQRSSATALKNGTTLDTTLDSVCRIRSHSSVPLVLMGYLNPIVEYGPDKFFQRAHEAGVDGIILPELPLEEVHRFSNIVATNHLSQILLVTPTTASERIRRIDSASSGFLYCVSTTGVTGSGHGTNVGAYVGHVRNHASKNPLLVGFGISTPEDAATIAQYSDGVIIGSALIRQLDRDRSMDELTGWVGTYRRAIDA